MKAQSHDTSETSHDRSRDAVHTFELQAILSVTSVLCLAIISLMSSSIIIFSLSKSASLASAASFICITLVSFAFSSEFSVLKRKLKKAKNTSHIPCPPLSPSSLLPPLSLSLFPPSPSLPLPLPSFPLSPSPSSLLLPLSLLHFFLADSCFPHTIDPSSQRVLIKEQSSYTLYSIMYILYR